MFEIKTNEIVNIATNKTKEFKKNKNSFNKFENNVQPLFKDIKIIHWGLRVVYVFQLGIVSLIFFFEEIIDEKELPFSRNFRSSR